MWNRQLCELYDWDKRKITCLDYCKISGCLCEEIKNEVCDWMHKAYLVGKDDGIFESLK